MPTRGRGPARECPVPHGRGLCGGRVAPGQLMCPHHWRNVPRPQRQAVYATLRDWKAEMSDPNWRRYLEARAHAINAAGGTR